MRRGRSRTRCEHPSSDAAISLSDAVVASPSYRYGDFHSALAKLVAKEGLRPSTSVMGLEAAAAVAALSIAAFGPREWLHLL